METQRCKDLKNLLTDHGVSYQDLDTFSMRVSPDVFSITQEEDQRLRARGQWFWAWLKQVGKLYQQGTHDPELAWLTDLFDKSFPQALRQFQRSSVLAERLPVLCRPDHTTLELACEAGVISSLGGWGYCHAIDEVSERLLPEEGQRWGNLAQGFAEYARVATGNDDPFVFCPYSPSMKYHTVQQYFTNCVQQTGLRIASGLMDELRVERRRVYWQNHEVNLIVISSSRFQRDENTVARLLAFEECGTVVEPPLNLVCGEKLALALPFHPRTRWYFPDETRAIFPETTLIEPGAYFQIDGERVYLDDFPKLGRSKRRYVIKYAGPDIKLISGARGVYNLYQGNSKQVAGILEQALSDFRHGHPWIMQPVVRAKYPIRYWDEQQDEIVTSAMYIRLTPFYLSRSDGTVALLGGAINTSNFWKVSGREDSVLLAVRVSKPGK